MSKRYEMGPKYDESTLVGALKQRGMDFSSVGPSLFELPACPQLDKVFSRQEFCNVWVNPLT